jgi:hypothetical protein
MYGSKHVLCTLFNGRALNNKFVLSKQFFTRKSQHPIAKHIPIIKKVKLDDQLSIDLVDDFSYLQDPSNPLTKSYIEKENFYYRAYFKGINITSLYEVSHSKAVTNKSIRK